jgi:NAD(P)H dehydrogenase (quinone)
MKKITPFLIVAVLVLLVVDLSVGQNQPTMLIAYYSAQGHTRAMAEAVANGARSVKGVNVKLLTVAEATNADVLSADAIIVGSPVYNASVAPPVQEFMNRWPFEGTPLKDKIGAAFVSAGGISAGEELTQLSILHSMLIFGMIVVGGLDWESAFGASAITHEEPFGKVQEEKRVSDHFLQKGEALGRRVAQLAVKWKQVH